MQDQSLEEEIQRIRSNVATTARDFRKEVSEHRYKPPFVERVIYASMQAEKVAALGTVGLLFLGYQGYKQVQHFRAKRQADRRSLLS